MTPTPPEGYRLLTDEEKKLPLPMDAMRWCPQRTRWVASWYSGERLHSDDQELIYATQRAPAETPDVSPVAGWVTEGTSGCVVPTGSCLICGWLRPFAVWEDWTDSAGQTGVCRMQNSRY